MNQNVLFFAKTRCQNRSLAELNEDFGNAGFAEKSHFEQNKINSNSFLVDIAYKKGFLQGAESNIIGLEIELVSRLPTPKGLILINWRWTLERTFSWLVFFRRHAKDYEKQPKVLKTGFSQLIAKLL